MTSPSYLRFPHVAGELLTFTAEDDVWAAPLAGGRAWRISADQAPVAHPRLSPDGTLVAWGSSRDGAPEVHVAPADGGPSRRLTYWGGTETAVRGWLPPGPDGTPEVLATGAHDRPSIRETWARAVPLDGGPARLLPYGPVGAVAFGPGPAVLLLSATMSRGRDAARWKRYRGGTAGKLWIDPDGSGTFRRLHENLDGNLECPMWVGERIAFLSDHEGTGALYSSMPDGTGLRRHTPVDDGYARQATGDGTRVVYACRGELWCLDDLDSGSGPRPLEVRLGGPRAARQPHPVNAAAHLGTACPDRTGRASAVETRGTVHWVTHRDGPVRALAAEPGVRARLPRVFRAPADGDGGPANGDQQVLWVTDAEGDDALALAPADGTTGSPPRLLAHGLLGRVLELQVAPDGSRAAVASHDGRVLLVGLADGQVSELDRSTHGDADGLAFSPDSRWLAWSHPGTRPLRQLRLADLTTGTVSEATPLRFRDLSPAFTTDGKHLAFLSERVFDPVYDAHVFDLSFTAACRPHLLTLAADTPSPFGPQRHGRPVDSAADRDEASGTGGTATGEDGPEGRDGQEQGPAAAAAAPPASRVDLDGLAERVVPFPVEAGRYSGLRAYADGVLWLRHPLTGALGTAAAPGEGPATSVQRYDLAKRRSAELAREVSGFEVSGDGRQVLLHTRSGLRLVPAEGGPYQARPQGDSDERGVTLDLSRIRLMVDPTAEWRQMYDEAGRLMRDNFWRADMGGTDWDAVLDRYRPVLDRVATHDDLVDLVWEVQGELDTSHAYVMPHAHRAPDGLRQGMLGADLSRDAEGRWRVDRVLPSESSDPEARSPLAAPGVAVRAGDVLLAVDGRPVDPVTGPAPLLAGAAERAVELTVEPADGSGVRHPVVVPLADEEALRYQAWVAGCRATVHERSGGRLGYLHIPDMIGSGWAQLHRDLHTEIGRDGVVVDVRGNRGGHLSQLVLEKLARRVIGWNLPRGEEPDTYPSDAPRGPIVVVANEFSGSDGDIVTAGVRALGLGPVVGTRTWGGVIGIDMRYDLVDGTGVTQPKYATWLRGFDWGVENYGVEPDIEVVRTPQDWAAGRDPQLGEALRVVLQALAASPAAAPPELPER
ncbi:S41 family peptidase [Streptomyces sodiiphilus]|uniref:Tricorn protease homolog n=1 Tax=Streptomyces sodiiphilus TaxID=226217 RepID=A0ABN2PQM5_9ACTN